MIDRSHGLSITSQAKSLNISRSSVYYLPRAVPAADLALMRRMDQLHLDFPFAGSRMLRELPITRPDQVWAMDITYVPMARGFVYLAAVIDWFSRRVLAWRLSITMEAAFCIEALEEALARYGRPVIFNTDQGSQFTSEVFTGVLTRNRIAISMDGQGAWRDNVVVERLWRSVKYEEVYLKAYDSVSEARASISRYLDFYN